MTSFEACWPKGILTCCLDFWSKLVTNLKELFAVLVFGSFGYSVSLWFHETRIKKKKNHKGMECCQSVREGQDLLCLASIHSTFFFFYIYWFREIQEFDFGQNWYCIFRILDPFNVTYSLNMQLCKDQVWSECLVLIPSDVWDISVLFFHSWKLLITRSSNYIFKS